MLRGFRDIPSAARWLGFTGLIPFLAAAVAGLFPSMPFHDLALRALLAYGAVILSFLGGIRWGMAIMAEQPGELAGPLGLSVVPSLLGWIALLLPTSAALVLLALGFAGMLLTDLRLATAPSWYRFLRLPLSVGAIGALVLGLLG